MTDTARVFNLSLDEEAALNEAAEAVRGGRCIVLPTDTVYGIGANAFDAAAVQGLLDAKERGRDMPPPVLIAEPSMLRAIADEVPEAATAMAKALWPGALTLVLKAQPRGGMDLGETNGTVAVRVPDHEGARALLRRTGPLAVSSANVSGQPAGLTCEETIEQLGDRVAVYLDGGPVSGGVASTIVDFAATDQGRVLRQGAIALETLREYAPDVVAFEEPSASEPGAEEQAAPTDQVEGDAALAPSDVAGAAVEATAGDGAEPGSDAAEKAGADEPAAADETRKAEGE